MVRFIRGDFVAGLLDVEYESLSLEVLDPTINNKSCEMFLRPVFEMLITLQFFK